jgi:hypothetical protein
MRRVIDFTFQLLLEPIPDESDEILFDEKATEDVGDLHISDVAVNQLARAIASYLDSDAQDEILSGTDVMVEIKEARILGWCENPNKDDPDA